jgi:hypothetical protein
MNDEESSQIIKILDKVSPTEMHIDLPNTDISESFLETLIKKATCLWTSNHNVNILKKTFAIITPGNTRLQYVGLCNFDVFKYTLDVEFIDILDKLINQTQCNIEFIDQDDTIKNPLIIDFIQVILERIKNDKSKIYLIADKDDGSKYLELIVRIVNNPRIISNIRLNNETKDLISMIQPKSLRRAWETKLI